VLAGASKCLLGAVHVTGAHQGLHSQRSEHGQERVWCVKELGQPLASTQGGQCLGIPATSQLKHGAVTADVHPSHRLGFGADRPLGALDPELRFLQPHLPGKDGAEYHVSEAGGQLVRPAVPPGQPDRLPAVLGRQLE